MKDLWHSKGHWVCQSTDDRRAPVAAWCPLVPGHQGQQWREGHPDRHQLEAPGVRSPKDVKDVEVASCTLW